MSGKLMPDLYDRRLVELTVGGAPGVPERQVWIGERYDPCYCPDCEPGAHWSQYSGQFETRAEAAAALLIGEGEG